MSARPVPALHAPAAMGTRLEDVLHVGMLWSLAQRAASTGARMFVATSSLSGPAKILATAINDDNRISKWIKKVGGGAPNTATNAILISGGGRQRLATGVTRKQFLEGYAKTLGVPFLNIPGKFGYALVPIDYVDKSSDDYNQIIEYINDYGLTAARLNIENTIPGDTHLTTWPLSKEHLTNLFVYHAGARLEEHEKALEEAEARLKGIQDAIAKLGV